MHAYIVRSLRPQVFTDFDLKEGDILISKDSNIGETVILDKDLPNHTISGALYKLPIKKNKYYLFAFLKHKYFLNQLNLLVPQGATIRHAKTLFLNCKIPFPNQRNKDEAINYVELLTQAIINKEKKIRKNHKQILEKFEKELLKNQKDKQFKHEESTFKEIKNVGRLDATIYTRGYKYYKFVLKNYKYGCFYLQKEDLKGGNTPKEQVRIFGIGNIKWITPTSINKQGILKEIKTIAIKNNQHNIKQDCLILINRGNKNELAQSFFYHFDAFKKGQHNQGCYRIDNKPKNELIFLTCLLNSKFYRSFVSYFALGSKLPEIKINQLINIPFPNFPNSKQQEIASLYYNPTNYPKNLSLQNFLAEDQKWNEQAGIIEIDKSMKKMKNHLNSVLDNIVNDEEVAINFDKFH